MGSRFLLDTRAFIWLVTGASSFSPDVAEAILDAESEIQLSRVSVWEMAIKSSVGKLDLHLPLATLLQEQFEANSLTWLEIKVPHLLQVERLPFVHRDPFDRLLVCQSVCERLTLISADEILDGYPIERVI